MNDRYENRENNNARILMYSQKNFIEKYLYRLFLYEFEDIVQKIDSVELLAPQPKKYFKNSNRAANRYEKLLTITANPKIKIRKYYDLFFAFCLLPKDLLYLNTIKGWDHNCKTSICWLNEIWIKEILRSKIIYKYFLKILSKFDYVILGCSESLNEVNKAVLYVFKRFWTNQALK
jgi:hypothetical protein